jgi:hypothetical protein
MKMNFKVADQEVRVWNQEAKDDEWVPLRQFLTELDVADLKPARFPRATGKRDREFLLNNALDLDCNLISDERAKLIHEKKAFVCSFPGEGVHLVLPRPLKVVTTITDPEV